MSALGLVWGLGAQGCTSEGPRARGSVVVPYLLGKGLDCDDPNVGVVRVKAILNDDVYEQEVSCGDLREIRIDEVDAGAWELVVEGYDANGVIIMDNRGFAPLPVVEVLGDGNVTTAAAVELSNVPAHLYLRWSEGFSDCDGLGIDRFEVSIWDSLGTTYLMRGDIACVTRPNAPQDYRRFEDPQRRIHGDTMQSLRVQPLDPHGVPVGQAVLFDLTQPPGAGYSVLASMTCTQEGCVATEEAQIVS